VESAGISLVISHRGHDLERVDEASEIIELNIMVLIYAQCWLGFSLNGSSFRERWRCLQWRPVLLRENVWLQQ
jgi:hypothetical protein